MLVMKLTKCLLRAALFILMLCSCQTDRLPDHSDFNSDDTETWELRPFYGEIRFLILDQDTGEAMPDVALQVSNLRIEEQIAGKRMSSGPDGLIIIHQLERGITYWGDGPAPATFTFSAPNYHKQTYSVAELVAGTSYDPYSTVDLPTTTYLNEDGKEIELPLYEFTIRLAPSD